MGFHWIIITILVIALGVFEQSEKQSELINDFATVDSLSRSLLIYRSAAAQYAQSNPGFTGVAVDSALNLPSWFSKPSGITAYLVAGQSYTYFSGVVPAGLAASLVDRTLSVVVGVNRSGELISPRSGQTGITLPSLIPDGAIVAVN